MVARRRRPVGLIAEALIVAKNRTQLSISPDPVRRIERRKGTAEWFGGAVHSTGRITVRYLMFIKHTEDYRNREIPAGLYEAMGEFVGEAMKMGIIIDTAGLKPTSEATRVRLSGRKISVTDGPFTESKEVVGGYALMELKSREEALAYAKRFMDLHLQHWPEFEGECEVRQVENQ